MAPAEHVQVQVIDTLSPVVPGVRHDPVPLGVEPELGCRAEVRLGPYPTEEEAAAALEKVEQRNREWETDPAWNDED